MIPSIIRNTTFAIDESIVSMSGASMTPNTMIHRRSPFSTTPRRVSMSGIVRRAPEPPVGRRTDRSGADLDDPRISHLGDTFCIAARY
jgi:hypothetical protein